MTPNYYPQRRLHPSLHLLLKGGSPGGSPASALAAFEDVLDDVLDDDWKSESAAPALADLDDELLSLADDNLHIRVPLLKPQQLHVASLRLAALSSETSRSPSVPSTPTTSQISGLPYSPTSTRAMHSVSTPVTERGSMPPPPTNIMLMGPASSVDGPKKKKKKEVESSKHAGSKLKAKVLVKSHTKKPNAKTVDASPSPSKAASKVPAVPATKK